VKIVNVYSVWLLLLLQADVVKFFREDLQKKLISPDFKKQIDGLDLLQRVCLLPLTR
jgi:hypothetical protein